MESLYRKEYYSEFPQVCSWYNQVSQKSYHFREIPKPTKPYCLLQVTNIK